MKYNIEIDEEGNKRYYVKNVLHREEGPAVEHVSGNKYWFKNGLYHREEGPAIKYVNGDKSWWLNGIYYGRNNDFTNESWQRFIKTLIFS